MADENPKPEVQPLESDTVSPHLTFPRTLWERVENAAHWEGYSSPSKLVCRVVNQWLFQREDMRDDGQYPKSPGNRKPGPKPKKSGIS